MKGKSVKLKTILLASSGVLIGALNGLLGGGGGMVTVPALHYLGDLPVKKAHATAIAVMLPLSVLSAITYTVGGVYHLGLGLTSGFSVTVGGLCGAALLSRLKTNTVAITFYVLMTAAGIYSLVRWFG